MSHSKNMEGYCEASKELKIPAPWGFLEALSWGEETESSLPLLLLHGILHNASSFNFLVPLLPKNLFMVSLDLPGHGKSSPLLSGVPLEYMYYVQAVKMVVDYLKWGKCYIIGHSLGAQLAAYFASIYPERVIKIVMIDGLTPVIIPEQNTVERYRAQLDVLDKIDIALKKRAPPSYSYDEALERLKTNGRGALTDEGAKALLERSLVPSGSGYRFSIDQRLKAYLNPLFSEGQIMNFVSSIKCPILLIIAEDTYHDPVEIAGDLFLERLRLFLLLPNVNFVLVKGNHNVHINDPKTVVFHINKFLTETKSAL